MEKILIAEDDPITRTMLARVVESMGYCSIQTSNGRHALEIVECNPDLKLVITDIAMPDVDGRTLVKQVRSKPETNKLPVMIISGVVSYHQIREILELGASRFLPKPLDIKEIKRLVPLLISGEEFAAQVAQP